MDNIILEINIKTKFLNLLKYFLKSDRVSRKKCIPPPEQCPFYEEKMSFLVFIIIMLLQNVLFRDIYESYSLQIMSFLGHFMSFLILYHNYINFINLYIKIV